MEVRDLLLSFGFSTVRVDAIANEIINSKSGAREWIENLIYKNVFNDISDMIKVGFSNEFSIKMMEYSLASDTLTLENILCEYTYHFFQPKLTQEQISLILAVPRNSWQTNPL